MSLEALFARRSQGIRLGLETVAQLHQALGAPAATVPAIHVVGTNGKGSTAACAAAALARHGRRVGLYTSPHLHRIVERVQVAGESVSDGALAEAVSQVLATESGQSLARPLSFFEVLTLSAWVLFERAQVDVIVAEAGMGGRWDATRICNAQVVAVAAIGLDHQAFLGSSVTEIAGEKAAVFRPGVPVRTVEQTPEAIAVLRQQAREVGCELQVVPPLARPPEGWMGDHQRHNAALALAAVQVLQPGARPTDLDDARWPGRCEWVAWGDQRILLDVAHNPQGVEALVRALQANVPDGRSWAPVVGCMADKDAAGIWSALQALGGPKAWVELEGGAPAPAGAPASIGGAGQLPGWIDAQVARGHTPVVLGSHALVAAIRARALGLESSYEPQDPRQVGSSVVVAPSKHP